MGCTVASSRVKVAQFCDDSSVQEESELFRWKVKSVRYAIKDPTLRCAFSNHLDKNKSGIEFLMCYTELEELKTMRDDHVLASTTAIIEKYQSLHNLASNPNSQVNVVWGKLNRLKSLDSCSNVARVDLMKLVTDAQHKMLGELAVPFEDFLESSEGWLGQNSKYDGESYRVNRSPSSVFVKLSPVTTKRKSVLSRDHTSAASGKNSSSPQPMEAADFTDLQSLSI